MRNILHLFYVSALVVAGLFAGCAEDPVGPVPPPDVQQPEVVVDQSEITIDNKGGEYTVSYTVKNPIEGVNPLAVTEAQWIVSLETTDGELRFTAAANTTDQSREAIIELRYPTSETTPTIKVLQGGVSSEYFNFWITDIEANTCISHVEPSDKQMTYVVFMSEVSYLVDMGIETAEALFEDDKSYFQSLADSIDSTLATMMMANGIAHVGDAHIRWTGMTPGSDCAVYVYGVRFNDDGTDYELITPITYEVVTPKTAEMQDITFTIEHTIDGPMVTHRITPDNWQGAFFYEYFPEGSPYYYPDTEPVTDDYTASVRSDWMELVSAYLGMGYSAESLLYDFCYFDSTELNSDLVAETKYMAQAYAIDIVDGLPQVVSKPTLKYFTTGIVEPSDMTFDYAVENVYVRVADVRITPSNSTDPYIVVVTTTADVPEGSDEEITSWALSTFSLSSYLGQIESHLYTLSPETGYTLLIFGYKGGVVTTPLTRYDFTTEAAGECTNSVVGIRYDGPYSPRELAAYDPENYSQVAMYEDYGYYVFWSQIVAEEPTRDMFHHHFSPQDAMYGQEYIAEKLINYAPLETQALTGSSGSTYILCGMVMDERGNLSKVWMSDPFSYDLKSEKRPLEELIEVLTSGTTRAGGSIVLVDDRGQRISLGGEEPKNRLQVAIPK